MAAVSNLPARNSPLDRPQRLGLLPTLSFWNDLRRQRLMRPFFLLAMLPLLPVFILLKLLHVPEWISSFAGIILYPILLMGLAERHIRKELRHRALTGEAGPPTASEAPPSRVRELAFPAVMAILAAVVAALILFDVGARAILVVLSVGSAGAVGVVVLQARRVADQIVEGTPRALPERQNRE